MITDDKTPDDFKHAWTTTTCLIIGDLILTGRNKKQLPKNIQLTKVDDLKHHPISLLKMKPEDIVLHIISTYVVSKNIKADSWQVASTKTVRNDYIIILII